MPSSGHEWDPITNATISGGVVDTGTFNESLRSHRLHENLFDNDTIQSAGLEKTR